MTFLLDGNTLVALCVSDHVHHDAAAAWFGSVDDVFATTPMTQGTLLRLALREGLDSQTALERLESVTGHERHVFWSDDRPYSSATLRGVIGHRQVTDAYLAELARSRDGRLATFDQGLASAHADVAELVAP